MKSLLKKSIPTFIWEGLRVVYREIRRLVLEIKYTASPLHPIEWMRMFCLVHRIRPTYSMIPPPRLRLLYQLSKEINSSNTSGDIVECGVYNGGSAAMMANPLSRSSHDRSIWLFDSFAGFPPPTENDGDYEREYYYEGWCEGSIEMSQEIFTKLGLPLDNVKFVKGWFEDTFPLETPKIKEISLLHIDADWYESVKICLETLYPKLVKGGYVVFDDYSAFSGCKKAVHEYMEAHNITARLETYDGLGVYFKKP